MHRLIYILLIATTLWSCNKDEIIEQDPEARLPRITFYNSTVRYYTEVGAELQIVPEYTNCGKDAHYLWTIDGATAGTSPNFAHTWTEPGTYYVTIQATNAAGSAREEVSVTVTAAGKPMISLPLAADRITVLAGAPYSIKADISNSKSDGFTVRWSIDGTVVSETELLTFTPPATGTYTVVIEAANASGSSSRQFTIEAVDKLPIDMAFAPVSHFSTSTTRYTYPGHGIYLRPTIGGATPSTYAWTVDGTAVACTQPYYVFTPSTPGQYTVQLTADGSVTASVTVVCVDASPSDHYRRAGAASSPSASTVYEYCPAPGQFIGDTKPATGMSDNITTLDQANQWALQRLNARQYVSLGAFGGYIVVGFDHSIPASSAKYQFSIQGNSYLNATTGKGGSNEPGIVYVMQDVNGNGLPDDGQWYELRGSESASPSTTALYAVTYFRPASQAMNVQWTDNLGATGVVPYLSSFHRQPYYYPAWIDADSYTLSGVCLAPRITQDATTGQWNSNPYPWGYADNLGSDSMDSDPLSPGAQSNGFSLSHAALPDGTPVNLEYIDFIKVQTGVNASMAFLGELSTEVLHFTDLSLK
ncbi:MAG: PKD domain-containing protein [Muribaculaceae bacterium]|nr:PKD domain-containing protein [Muribaculaceae bacterium]